MAKPPRRGGKMRVFYPVFQVTELALGRHRARCLTVRLPMPPVRPVRETFASYGSREKDMMGKVHFANSTERSPWSACAFAGYLCTVSRPSPSGPSPCTSLSYAQTPMAHVTACRASELAARVSPASFPLSFASLAGSPVFPVENAHEMLEVACSFMSLPRSGAPSSCSGGGQVYPYPLVRVPGSHAHRAYSCACGSPFQLDELTSQARSVRGLFTVGRIRARCLSVRLPNPPVRTVLAAFIAHGSREKDVYRKCPFRQLHGVHRGQLARSLTTFVPFSLPSPSGPSPCMELSYMRTPMPHLTACRALESSLGSLPAYSPPSFTSLAGSPVFPMEDSNKTR